jgi:hypothetical protein
MKCLKDSNTHCNKPSQDGIKPAMPVLSCPFDARAEFDKLTALLHGSNKWAVEERMNYFAFFCHGWNGRSNDGAWQ